MTFNRIPSGTASVVDVHAASRPSRASGPKDGPRNSRHSRLDLTKRSLLSFVGQWDVLLTIHFSLYKRSKFSFSSGCSSEYPEKRGQPQSRRVRPAQECFLKRNKGRPAETSPESDWPSEGVTDELQWPFWRSWFLICCEKSHQGSYECRFE